MKLKAVFASQLLIVAVIYGIGFFCNGYTLDYWTSQVQGTPSATPKIVVAGVSLFTPGFAIPAALVTYAFDAANGENDVPPLARID